MGANEKKIKGLHGNEENRHAGQNKVVCNVKIKRRRRNQGKVSERRERKEGGRDMRERE